MKNTLLTVAIVAVAVIALGVTGWAYAQSPSGGMPYAGGMMGQSGSSWMGGGSEYGGMYGQGMMGMGSGMMDEYGAYGSMMQSGMMGDHADMEALHDYMEPAMAAALGLTEEAFETRHENGETFWDIAKSQGLTVEETWALMESARDEALREAVEDGVIDEAFAAWMVEHSGQMHGDGAWDGSGHCDEAEAPIRTGNDL